MGYFGFCNEYLLVLEYIKPFILEKYPGINLLLACRNDLQNKFPNFISYSEVIEMKKELVYLKEIKCNLTTHPIDDFISENKLNIQPIISEPARSKICVVYTKGMLPTKSIDKNTTEIIVDKIKRQGYQTYVDLDVEDPGYIVSVENEFLVKAGLQKTKIGLIPTGLGTELYKKIFPTVDILKI